MASPVSLGTLVFTISRELLFSTRARTFSSGRSRVSARSAITRSGSSTWLWITDTVQTVRLSAITVPFRSMILPLAALMVLSLWWRSSAFPL